LATDEHLLDWARQTAPMLLEKYPDMAERHIARWLGGKSEFLKA
jgi:ATP-dependent DNA helicase RecG